jgi:hypothetical protein
LPCSAAVASGVHGRVKGEVVEQCVRAAAFAAAGNVDAL